MKKAYLKVAILFGCVVLLAVFVTFVLKRQGYQIVNVSDRNVRDEINYTTIKNRTVDNTIDILDTSVFELIEGEYRSVLYINNGIEQKVTHNGQKIDYLKFSPLNNKLGFFYESGNYLSAGRDIALAIMDIGEKSIKKVYEGSFKTSYWEWLNNEEVVVYYGCGTECMVAFIIDVNSGERKSELQYGVGHEWSPNKKLVLAYNYSYRYGITVGDKIGNVFFSIKREPVTYHDLIYKTKATWSPDSNKIAVIIKKENQDQLELFVFDVKENFKQLFQSDVDFFEDMEFNWDNNEKLIYNDLEIIFKI